MPRPDPLVQPVVTAAGQPPEDRDELELTGLLARLAAGDGDVIDALAPRVRSLLERVGHALMRRERHDHTWDTSDLVHEAWLRLVHYRGEPWRSRDAFLAMAATVMRNMLVSHARERAAEKRGGHMRRLPFEVLIRCLAPEPLTAEELLDLHASLDKLAVVDERAARIIELRFFGGLTIAETARAMGLGHATVEVDFRAARGWLQERLAQLWNERTPDDEPDRVDEGGEGADGSVGDGDHAGG